jgi:hypothetical protein
MTENFEARLKRHMPRSRDLTLIVLKGHLLLEESIDHLLAALLRNSAALHPARLSVFARLCLVRALLPLSEEMMKAAEGLNTLRNKLAHHLEHPQVERLTNDFLYQFENPNHIDPDDPADFDRIPVARRLKLYIVALCAFFEGAAIGVGVLRQENNDKLWVPE